MPEILTPTEASMLFAVSHILSGIDLHGFKTFVIERELNEYMVGQFMQAVAAARDSVDYVLRVADINLECSNTQALRKMYKV